MQLTLSTRALQPRSLLRFTYLPLSKYIIYKIYIFGKRQKAFFVFVFYLHFFFPNNLTFKLFLLKKIKHKSYKKKTILFNKYYSNNIVKIAKLKIKNGDKM